MHLRTGKIIINCLKSVVKLDLPLDVSSFQLKNQTANYITNKISSWKSALFPRQVSSNANSPWFMYLTFKDKALSISDMLYGRLWWSPLQSNFPCRTPSIPTKKWSHTPENERVTIRIKNGSVRLIADAFKARKCFPHRRFCSIRGKNLFHEL
jgi:hypothetical protein